MQFHFPQLLIDISNDNFIDGNDDFFVGGPPLADLNVFVELLRADKYLFSDLVFLFSLGEVLDVEGGGWLFVENGVGNALGGGL